VVKGIRLMEKLDQRMQLDYATYEQIHTRKRTQSVVPPQGEFAIEKIGAEGTRLGARYYQWIASKVAVAY
jgi:hydroxymethylglutaryl-CoA synthase